MEPARYIWCIAAAAICAIIAFVMMMIQTALQTISPSHAERLVNESVPRAQRVKQIVDDPAPTITAAMFLRVVCEVTCVVVASIVIMDKVSSTGLALATSIVVLTLVSFIAWGVAPQTLGRQHGESIALNTAPLMGVISTLLWPISQLLIWVGNAITPGRGFTDGPFSPEAEMIAEASEGEREMINSVFELGDTLAKEVMVPRTDVVYIEQGKTLRQGLSLALRSGFSRIPVVESGLDDVVGIVYLKDLMRRVYDNPDAERKETIASLMKPASFAPDSKPVDELMREMQVSRHHMVVVVDEFGGTAGVATIEDVVEEIVGEITDEYDAEPDLAEDLGDQTWRVSARMPVDDMGDLFGLELDDEDVETVGGLLAKQLNMVPIKGSQVVWRGLEITAEKSTPRRHQIDTVLVRRREDQSEDDDE